MPLLLMKGLGIHSNMKKVLYIFRGNKIKYC